MISHEEARVALAQMPTEGITLPQLVLRAYIDQEASRVVESAPVQPTEALFTEAQVMELVVVVRDAMLGALPRPPATLSTLELFAWLHAHGGSSMTNTGRSERRSKADAQRFRAEAFVEGMRWRYGMRMDRAAKAISAWRERYMGAIKPEPPAVLSPEQAMLLAEILRETERPSFGHVAEEPSFGHVAEEQESEAADEEANAP